MTKEELIELLEFTGLDEEDGCEHRDSIVSLYQDLQNRDYLIESEGFFQALEKECKAQLDWYKKHFIIRTVVEEIPARKIETIVLEEIL